MDYKAFCSRQCETAFNGVLEDCSKYYSRYLQSLSQEMFDSLKEGIALLKRDNRLNCYAEA